MNSTTNQRSRRDDNETQLQDQNHGRSYYDVWTRATVKVYAVVGENRAESQLPSFGFCLQLLPVGSVPESKCESKWILSSSHFTCVWCHSLHQQEASSDGVLPKLAVIDLSGPLEGDKLRVRPVSFQVLPSPCLLKHALWAFSQIESWNKSKRFLKCSIWHHMYIWERAHGKHLKR